MPSYRIGTINATMPAAIAKRWNDGNWSEDDEREIIVYDPESNHYMNMVEATESGFYDEYLCGNSAERIRG